VIQDNPTAFVEVKSFWNFKRAGPAGNEESSLNPIIKLSCDSFKPIIDLLEE
jgi:hypothetical protein